MTFKSDDEITLTFSGLKQAQNEAFQEGIEFAANRIARFFDKEPNLEKILELLSLLAKVEAYAETDQEESEPICLCGSEGCEA
jgi:hypothetical protein